MLLLLSIDIAIVYATHGKSKKLDIQTIQKRQTPNNLTTLILLNMNIAHGRGNGRHQLLQSKDTIQKQIATIADIVKREKANIVALQEIDAPSWWSGEIAQLHTIAKRGGMRMAVQGLHVDGLGLHYGTAITSNLDALEAHQVTFDKNIPTLSKGFVVTTYQWPGTPLLFDVISLHLDFANPWVREKQLAHITQVIQNNKRPVIIMGDFNTDMQDNALSSFVQTLQLHTWKPEDTAMITFETLNSRIDWVFVSDLFKIEQQTILEDIVSDHKIVKTIITLQHTNHIQ